jgi:hypothetical protein
MRRPRVDKDRGERSAIAGKVLDRQSMQVGMTSRLDAAALTMAV